MELFVCMSALNPMNSFASYDRDKVLSLANFYPNDFSSTDLMRLSFQLDNFIDDMRSDDRFKGLKNLGELSTKLVETRKHDIYKLVCLLLKLVLLLPVATASVERVFSAMNLVKNKLRNSMGDQVLNDCLVTFIERDIFSKAKCLEMLPEVQREEVRAISSGDQSQFASQTMQMSSPVNHLAKSPNPATRLSSSFTPVLQKKSSPLHSRNINASTDSGCPVSSARSEFGRKVPSILQCRPVPQGTPTSNTRSTAGSIFPSVGQNSESPYLKGTKEFGFMKGESGFKKGTKPADHDSLPKYFSLGSGDTPMKDYRTSLLKTEVNKTTFFQGKDSVRKGEFDFSSRAEKPFILSGTGVGLNGHSKVSENAGFHEVHIQKTKVPTKENVLSLGKKSSIGEAAAGKGGSRWRSDESSEDEDEKRTSGYMESGASLGTRRQPRFSRR